MKPWKRPVLLYLSSQLLTQFGTSLVSYAIFWHITLETQSGAMITLYTLVGFLPTLFLSPFAGVWADRYDRKALIIWSDLAIAASSLIFAFFYARGYEALWLLFLISAIRALGSGIQTPASNALLPQLVPREELVKVNGWMSSASSIMGILSPIAGAALLAVADLDVVLLVDVVTAAAGVGILLRLAVPPYQECGNGECGDFFQDLKGGLRYIRQHPYIYRLFLYFAVFYFFVSPAAFLTPLQVVRLYGEEIYRLTAIEIGFFVGMLAGGGLIGFWGGFRNRIHTLILSILLGALLNIFMGLPISFLLYLGVMVLMGISVVMFQAPTNGLLQERVPEDVAGRVFGVLNMISTSMFPLGLLLFGPLADKVSIEVIMLGTGGILLLQGAWMVRDRGLLAAGEPLDKRNLSEGENI